MKARRFFAGFLFGWLILGTILYFTTGWAGSGLTGAFVGAALGWLNIDRGDQTWVAYLKERAQFF